MEKTVCELFAGVGGFRCGLNSIKKIEDTNKREKWDTVWFSQWEPEKKISGLMIVMLIDLAYHLIRMVKIQQILI